MRTQRSFAMAIAIALITALMAWTVGVPVVDAAPTSPTDESVVPHYFGPWPNWANSQFTLPDVEVVITDPTGSGSGATAEASVGANGTITGLTLTNGGSGYQEVDVSFIASTPHLPADTATATATIVPSGAITGVDIIDGGGGYTAPTVSFSGATGTGATAVVYGGVDSITVVDGGAGYTAPVVDFDLPTDPNGDQARGHAVMDASGTITEVIVDSPGSGYTVAPGVTILNGTANDPVTLAGTPASVTSSLLLSSLQVTDPGSGYDALSTSVVFNDPTGSGALASVTVADNVIGSIDLLTGGSGYVTPGIRKFVDSLPLAGPVGTTPKNGNGQYIPIAVPDTETFTELNGYAQDSDHYIIAVTQWRETMHSDIPATLLREYVQLVPEKFDASGNPLSCAARGGRELQTALLDGATTPTLMPDGSPACGYDEPHYMGPMIVAQKNRAVRVTFYNLLPTGADGDLFLPVDPSFMGSGMGPAMMGMEGYDPRPVAGGTVIDEARSPFCDEVPKPSDCFKDNRALLHLHGGITPWISDGTPHQWITPANEDTPYPQGVSVESVPDMVTPESEALGVPNCNDPRDGCSTFYYTNQQSARLMFYHDHSWGTTRLNVYAGEAAAYQIQDDTENALKTAGIVPEDEIPLVIQDRTFVPSDEQMYDVTDADGNVISYGQDPTWNAERWGGEGSLWYEHVYMPAQNPGDPSGMSAYGRWMYGPWFWPPQTTAKYGPIDNPYFDPNCNLDDPATWQYETDPYCEPALIPGTPNNSAGMEQFNDTPIVNGTAYPTVTLEPKAYRLRILNAANDRFWNLSWYEADPNTASTGLNAAGDPIGGTEVAFNADELAAAQLDPNIVPTPDTAVSPAGPDWIQIGNEGGFLPAPAVIPAQPTTWIIDPTLFSVGNVDQHSLLLAPAERADAVVDFSQYAGKTLILYNDAPAAFPARVSTYDYYTGAPDLSPIGAPTILPGYGPNTRTVMQVKIAPATPAPAFNLSALQNAFKHQSDGSGVFESGQHPTIVGQAAYNSAYGTSFAKGAWCNAPSSPASKCDGLARIQEQGGDLFKFDTVSGNQVAIPIEPKALHDEMNESSFDDFGRMMANMGVESVPATPGGQNINLMPFMFPQTEVIDASQLPQLGTETINGLTFEAVSGISEADGTQVWKITHNGVDTHPIHFHLYDVQVLNRVGWDNQIFENDANEYGWKDTVRISPLQDTYVVLRPIIPWLPFEIPNSVRALSPMDPLWNGIYDPAGDNLASLGDVGVLGSADLADQFALGIPPSAPNGEPIDVLNHLVNFGWEYVWHCHILSHEEMDMMRPVSVAIPPRAPVNATIEVAQNGNSAKLSWTDNSVAETGYVVERKRLNDTNWTEVHRFDILLSEAPNTTGGTPMSWTTPTGGGQANRALRYLAGDQYRVRAINVVGDTWNYATNGNELDPNVPAFPVVTVGSEWVYFGDPSGMGLHVMANTPSHVDLAWTDVTANETGFLVERHTSANQTWVAVGTAPAGATSFVDDTVAVARVTYTYRVTAVPPPGGAAVTSNEVTVTKPRLLNAPTNVAAAATSATQVDVTWTDNQGGQPNSASTEDGFIVERSTNGGAFVELARTGQNVTSYSDTAAAPLTDYVYRVTAFRVDGGLSASVESNKVTTPGAPPAAPTNLAVSAVSSNRVDLRWTDNSSNEDGFVVQRRLVGDTLWTDTPVAAGTTAYSDTFVATDGGKSFEYQVFAQNAFGPSAATNQVTVDVPTGSVPAAPSNPTVVARTQTSLTVRWTDNSLDEDGFKVQIATNRQFSSGVRTLDTKASNVRQLQVAGLSAKTRYYIRVLAYNTNGDSAWSTTIVDTTLR